MKRECGDCQLCCKLLPTIEVPTPAGERCKHQRHAIGCAIYPNRPLPCQLWSCRWLTKDDTAGMRRPDRSRYVIDMMPDFIEVCEPGGEPFKMEVVQIWVDPNHRNAYRDPALYRYLRRRWKQDGVVGLIRYSDREAFTMLPNPDGTFLEKHGECTGKSHSAEELVAALGDLTMTVAP